MQNFESFLGALILRVEETPSSMRTEFWTVDIAFGCHETHPPPQSARKSPSFSLFWLVIIRFGTERGDMSPESYRDNEETQ
mgnify:CR=1 FL=1